MHTHFAADAPLDIDLAPALQVVELIVLLHLDDAVDRADLEAALAAGAVVGIDDREFLRQFLAGASFCHGVEDRRGRGGKFSRLLCEIMVAVGSRPAKSFSFERVSHGFAADQVVGRLPRSHEPGLAAIHEDLGRQRL